MFEWIVMGFFIGLPVFLVVGAFVAWLYQRRQTFELEDLEADHSPDVAGGTAA